MFCKETIAYRKQRGQSLARQHPSQCRKLSAPICFTEYARPFDHGSVIELPIHFGERLCTAYSHSPFIIEFRVDVDKSEQTRLISTRQEHNLCLAQRALAIKKQGESWQSNFFQKTL